MAAVTLRGACTALLAFSAGRVAAAPSSQPSQPRAAEVEEGFALTNPTNKYDYVVVGSGPGGGPLAANLARAGKSVLLIEAGDDQSQNLNSAIPQLFPFGYTDASLRWDFFVRHYSDDARTLRNNQLVWQLPDGQFWVGPGTQAPANATMLGIYYPRGGTLGGSSANNAMGTVLPSDKDWQYVADLTGDSSWSPTAMRGIFKKIERNHYLPAGTAGHGFSGWMDTNQGNASGWAPYTNQLKVLGALAGSLGQNGSDILNILGQDINPLSTTRDTTTGLYDSALHVTAEWRRFSSRDYVLETANATTASGRKKYPLYLSLNTLATKVLFQTSSGSKPKATGVAYLQGSSLYKADPQYNPAASGTSGTAKVNKEVIIAGGVFNSPQLLKLSGVGPAAELTALNIPVVVNLPGVGTNLQENYEVPVVATFNDTFAIPTDPNAPVCTFGAPGDPCVALWRQGQGPYMSFGNLNGAFRKTAYPNQASNRDHFFTGGTFAIRGFRPPSANAPSFDGPNTFALSTVKMNTVNRAGTVKLRSADPRDTPLINFGFFSDGTASAPSRDLLAIGDTIKWARRTFASVTGSLSPVTPMEPPCASAPAADGSCDDEVDRQWVMDQAFGHHATSTCAIGADGDGMAVLDGRFRVRGTKGLRVVDASAFPRIPGAFPVLPVFMISEKASAVVLADA